MIELRDVSVCFKQKEKEIQAVDSVDLTIEKGDVYGIVGYSGAGKSTLVRVMNLLQKPTAGEVIVNQTNLSQLSPKELRKERKAIGMIFQHFNLMESRTIFDNVDFSLKYSGKSKQERRQKVNELLELVGLEEKASAYPKQLSGGQKQRVAIARALANEPKVLLCAIDFVCIYNRLRTALRQTLQSHRRPPAHCYESLPAEPSRSRKIKGGCRLRSAARQSIIVHFVSSLGKVRVRPDIQRRASPV